MTEDKERGAKLRKAYGTATAQLRTEHIQEFRDLYVKAAADLGVEYTPPPTEDEKAEREMEDLLSRHPHLRERFATKADQAEQ